MMVLGLSGQLGGAGRLGSQATVSLFDVLVSPPAFLPQKSEEGDIKEKRPCYATRVVPTSSGIETPFYFATLCRMRLLFLVEGTSLPGGVE